MGDKPRSVLQCPSQIQNGWACDWNSVPPPKEPRCSVLKSVRCFLLFFRQIGNFETEILTLIDSSFHHNFSQNFARKQANCSSLYSRKYTCLRVGRICLLMFHYVSFPFLFFFLSPVELSFSGLQQISSFMNDILACA